MTEVPRASVVIRSCNEADRLRLTLTSLACQTLRAEVVVVNDGSTDHTARILAEAQAELPLTVIHHPAPHGRSAASNAGARAATGDFVVFLDGDTLASPALVERHAAVHRDRTGLLVRGETWHLRCTRFLLDPETARPQAAHAARLQALSEGERAALAVTRNQIRHAFDEIERRGQRGIYPGFGPTRLYDLEMAAIRDEPDCDVLWAAVSGNNLSVNRQRFLDLGGFEERIDSSEHREFALRFQQDGGRIVGVEGARTYHLTHRSGWRDPLSDTGWHDLFYAKHPISAVALLPTFWAGLSAQGDAPIKTLPELAAAAALATAQRADAETVSDD